MLLLGNMAKVKEGVANKTKTLELISMGQMHAVRLPIADSNSDCRAASLVSIHN